MPRRLDPRAYESLLGTLDAGARDSIRPGDVWSRLAVAWADASAGDFDSARAHVAEALDDDAPAFAHHIAGLLLYITRDHARALTCFTRAVELDPRLTAVSLGAQAQRAQRLGWDAEARRIVSRLLSAEPQQLRWHIEALRLASRTRDHEAAIEHADSAIALQPDAANIHMERASILSQLGRSDEAIEAAERAVEIERRSLPYLLEAARIAEEAGAYDRAESHLARAHARDPRDVRATVALARLSLYRGALDEAERVLAPAVASAGEHPLVRRSLAALLVLRREHEAALETLLDVVRDAPRDYEAYTWLAEAHVRLGDFEAAYGALHRATMCADGYLLPAWILRSLAHMIAADDGDDVLESKRFGELADGVEALVPGGAAELASGDRTRVRRILEEALRRLGGNRTTRSSQLTNEGLARLTVRTTPRHASRHALQLIRSATPDRALAALDDVVARYPHSSLPICHRGELRLWLGDLAGARRDLEAALAIDRGTRWAWIGLTAIEVAEGRPAKALEVSAEGVREMSGTVGASVYAYRAEAHRALGDLAEARADLNTAIEASPTRLAAHLALYLLDAEEGDDAEASRGLRHFAAVAPALLSDAASVEGITLFHAPTPAPSAEETERLLRRALSMLGTNRSSSCVTYRAGDGELRYVPRAGGRGPHDTDADDLGRVRTALMRAMGLTRAKPPRSGRSASAPAPSALVEHFVEHGFVRVERAFSREVADAWVQGAIHRIESDPGRWVQGYDGSDSERSLAAFRADDPATWTWERFDLLSSRELPLAELSPRTWDLACTLVGGAKRFARAMVSDHLVVNLHTRSKPEFEAPPLGASSWHLDDPSETETLEGFTRGLILFILLSDLPSGAGAPFVAPESVAMVAKELADTPGGVDFVSRTTSARLTAQCTRSVELTGSAGDIFVVHPLMLHSSSGNPSGKIRWMANPILTLIDPPRHGAVDPSPLELTIGRALRVRR